MTKTLDSTAVYAYTTLISMIVCLPFAIIAEGSALQAGAAAAIAKVGAGGSVLRMVGVCCPKRLEWQHLPSAAAQPASGAPDLPVQAQPASHHSACQAARAAGSHVSASSHCRPVGVSVSWIVVSCADWTVSVLLSCCVSPGW